MNNLERAKLSLEGLSIGDAFGQMFFGNEQMMPRMIEQRAMPTPPWLLTDDSIMAIGIVETLEEYKRIDQDYLAQRFAFNYKRNYQRGYGGMAHLILRTICEGEDWRIITPAVFDGMGSYGNGAAMRVAPLGAFYSDDIEKLVSEASASAEVTHSHEDGKAGAVAIALASAWAHNNRNLKGPGLGNEMLGFVLQFTPDSATNDGIAMAQELSFNSSIENAVSVLGNGTMVSSQDTVPFVLWCVAGNLDNFEEALWTTVSGLGDRDTTCAMVGGILVLRNGIESIPNTWMEARESLTDWEALEFEWHKTQE